MLKANLRCFHGGFMNQLPDVRTHTVFVYHKLYDVVASFLYAMPTKLATVSALIIVLLVFLIQ